MPTRALPVVVALSTVLGLTGSVPDPAAGSGPGPGAATSVPGGPVVDQLVPLQAVPADTPTLWPGRGGRFDVVVDNPNDGSVEITGMEVRVSEVDSPRARPGLPCAAADFEVRPGDVAGWRVGPSTRTTLAAAGLDHDRWPWLGMLETGRDQDGCQGARLVIAVRLTARVA